MYWAAKISNTIFSFTHFFAQKIFFPIKFKNNNSVKNHRTWTQFELDLHIPMTYPYKHVSNLSWMCALCNCYWDNEWKVNDDKRTEWGNIICPRSFYGWGITKIWMDCIIINSTEHGHFDDFEWEQSTFLSM